MLFWSLLHVSIVYADLYRVVQTETGGKIQGSREKKLESLKLLPNFNKKKFGASDSNDENLTLY